MTEYYDTWDPANFDINANYQLAIREFTRGQVQGDVLDAGCGSRIVYSLRNAASWNGVDVSEIMTGQAVFNEKPDWLEVRFHKADIRSLPFTEKSFDTVIVQFVLHHLGERSRKESFRQVSRALNELKRVTRTDGKIIIVENASGPLEWPYHLLFPLFWRLGLALGSRLPFFLRYGQIKQLAKGAGLKFITAMHIPIDEKIYNPVLKFRVPTFFSSELFMKMTLFLFERCDE
jgi:ubiquinone/menaquinone biosynthesis C-methylase UbiE